MYKTKIEINLLGKKLPANSLLILKDGLYRDDTGLFIFDEKTILENEDKFEKDFIKVEELNGDEDDKIKSWRIQLDVKCSTKKLRAIQDFINSNISTILQ